MSEHPPNFEIKKEHIPTLEEVLSLFSELTGNEFEEVRRLEDEKGLYLLEIVIPGDLPDETIEYAYMRKGRHEKGQTSATVIHVTYYKNDIPISGTSVAEYIEGKWKIFPDTKQSIN